MEQKLKAAESELCRRPVEPCKFYQFEHLRGGKILTR